MERDLLHWIGIVPLLPLIGAAVLMLFGRRIGAPLAGWIAAGLMGLAFLWSLVMLAAILSLPENARSVTSVAFTWIQVDQLQIDFGFLADPLSITWILLVTGVGSLIFLYSIGYMRGDPNFSRFFAYMSLFAGSMLLLVTGSSYLLTFLGWEGVGLCSYLLIAFWFERSTAAKAGKKAFITNRVGDVGFLIAMFILIKEFGTLDYGANGSRGVGRLEHDRHRGRAAAPARGGREERPDPALPLADRRDGGPDSGLGADPRRDHGDRRRVPDRPRTPVLRRER